MTLGEGNTGSCLLQREGHYPVDSHGDVTRSRNTFKYRYALGRIHPWDGYLSSQRLSNGHGSTPSYG